MPAGCTLQKCARRRGVKESTVRWHFKHVLSKGQTNPQAQLVRLLHATGAGVVVPAAPGPSTAPAADQA